MKQPKPLTNRVTDELLKNALLSSVDLAKLKTSIHSLLGVMLTVDELKKFDTFHQLFEAVKEKQVKTK